MSWFDDIESYKLVPITTGDGTTYELKMRFKGGSIAPLTKTYNYAGKVGSKPKRNSCASPVYDLVVFIYQDNWKSFKNSISDPSAEWLVKHPLYGDLKGLPTAINWDNTTQGDVEFNFQFQQSIDEDTPLIKTDYQAKTRLVNLIIQEQVIEDVGDIEFTEAEVTTLSGLIDSLEEAYEGILNSEYANKLYDIRQTINEAEFDSFRFMSLVNDMLNISSRLNLSVKERITIISSQMASILSIDALTISMAKFNESAGASNITALMETVITPSESVEVVSGFDVTDISASSPLQDDYKYKKDVLSTINSVNTLYNNYISTISEISITEDEYTQFVPNNDLVNNINESFLLGIQEIKDISNKAKEENVYITQSDTSIELLAHILYGSATDENMNSIINDNDLFGKENITYSWRNMIIKQGTNILYYV